MKNVKITWKAFGNKPDIGREITSIEFKLPVDDKDFVICERIYKETNLYQGSWWSLLIEPLLKENRTHTALSVGDEVTIDDITYICADFGFIKVEDAEIKYLGDDIIFSISEKKG